MNIKFHANEDKSIVSVSINVDLSLSKPGEGLSDGQCKALDTYCKKIIANRIKTTLLEGTLDGSIVINASEIYRQDGENSIDRIDRYYYDATTGELLSDSALIKRIMDGHHEIRINSINT